MELLRPVGGQHDRAREGIGIVAGPLRRGLQSRLHSCRVPSVEVDDVQHPCRRRSVQLGSGKRGVGLAPKA